MAEKVPENVDGPWYVTDECVSCGLCIESAPDYFKFTPGETHAYVHRQPETDAETEACKAAKDDCPADAIKCS